MLFKNVFSQPLPGVPSFEGFWINDINPLGRTWKKRQTYKQNRPMKLLHQRLSGYIRRLNVELPAATAFRNGDSPKRNVLRHKGNRFFYLTDLKGAYPSIDIEKLASVLCQVDQALTERGEEVLAFLKRFCLAPEGGLVTGASASPDLFNLYAGILLDKPLLELCHKYGLTYSRYCDDLTFSSKESIGERKRRAIRQIIEKAGFDISHGKSKVYDLEKGPITINGIGINQEGRIFLPRYYLRRIKRLIKLAEQGNKEAEKTVHGMMGPFWSSSESFNKLNQTEWKLVRQYRSFQRQQKQQKRR